MEWMTFIMVCMYGIIAIVLIIKTTMEQGKRLFKVWLGLTIVWLLPAMAVLLAPCAFFTMLVLCNRPGYHIG